MKVVLVLAALLILSSAQLNELQDGDVVTFSGISSLTNGCCVPSSITFYYYGEGDSYSYWSFNSQACSDYYIYGSYDGGSIESNSTQTFSSGDIAGYSTYLTLFDGLNLEGWMMFSSNSYCNFWTNTYNRYNEYGYNTVDVTLYNNITNSQCCVPSNLTIQYEDYSEGESSATLYWSFPDNQECEDIGLYGYYNTESQIDELDGVLVFSNLFYTYDGTFMFNGSLVSNSDQLQGSVSNNYGDNCEWMMVPYYLPPPTPIKSIPVDLDFNLTVGNYTIFGLNFTSNWTYGYNLTWFEHSESGAGRLIYGSAVGIGLALITLVF